MQDLYQVGGEYTSAEVLAYGIPSNEEPPKPTKCRFCGKTLYYTAFVSMGRVIVWNRSHPQRCDCTEATAYWAKYDAEKERQKEETELAEQRRVRQARIDRLIGNSGLKKRFLSRTFDSFEVNLQNRAAFETAKAYVEQFDRYAANGKGIYFEGTCGTGKTHLAAAIALGVLQKGVPVVFKTSIDMLADIKRTYGNTLVSESEVLSIYRTADLLIIDDLGKEQCTEWSVPVLYSIINERYENMLPTIITTNYNEDGLIKRLTPNGGDRATAEAIISRLWECTDVVTMAWADYRR